MFNKDFYPTPTDVIDTMTSGEILTGKVVLEPSAGSGNIVDYLLNAGAKDVIACENNENLKKILATKCKIVEDDFLNLTSDKISHIDLIVMNPPFSADAQHILHAYNIAPPGCKIIALCNVETLKNPYSKDRKILASVIESFGDWRNLGDCFSEAERKTGVHVGLIKIQKAGENYSTEFEGFFTEEDEAEIQENGIMSYNVIRDLVNRYVAAIKIYDKQLSAGIEMNNLLSNFYGEELAFSCTEKGAPKLRNDFKKDMQKAGWKFIFKKMNLTKFATRGVKEDINKFVEQQTDIPFTMKNIYHMLDLIVQTAGQRMDKALLEVFDKLTEHHHDNRFNVEGWKTNSHFLVNRKFILPHMCFQDQRWHKGESKIRLESYGSSFYLMEDLTKALCYITGDKYYSLGSLDNRIRHPYKTITEDEVFYHNDYDGYNGYVNKKEELYKKGIKCEMVHSEPIYGEWFEWGYFRCKAFKKGSMHFEFKDQELWGKFNQRIAKLKGYPLFEGKTQTAYQDRQTGRKTTTATKAKVNPTILSTIKLKST